MPAFYYDPALGSSSGPAFYYNYGGYIYADRKTNCRGAIPARHETTQQRTKRFSVVQRAWDQARYFLQLGQKASQKSLL